LKIKDFEKKLIYLSLKTQNNFIKNPERINPQKFSKIVNLCEIKNPKDQR